MQTLDQPSQPSTAASAQNAAKTTAQKSPLEPYPGESALKRLVYNILEAFLQVIIGLIVSGGRPGKLTDAQRRTVTMVKDSIYARLVVEGYISRGRGANRYPEWDALNEHLYQQGSASPSGIGVGDAEFIAGLEELVSERFSSGNAVKPLINGPASFEQRYRIIDLAKESIYLATWKLYGDHTGMKTADALLAKRRQSPGIDIRVMVDGNVAVRDPASLAQLKRLVDGGIPVVFYHHDQRPFDGFHYKELIADGTSDHPIAIAGGMNIGDEYSQGFGTPAATDPDRRQWRDTDVLIEGPNVRDDCLKFIQIWNDQVSRPNAIEPFGQPLTPITRADDLPLVSRRGEAQILTTLDEPGPHSAQKTTLAMVRSIRGASRSVEIENAYFMDVPTIRNALLDAMQRGVCVRLLTNSTDSVDEKAVSVPILKGVYRLLAAAETAGVSPEHCRVYVRNRLHPRVLNADTLHSKFMVVDKVLCQVTSLNIHARSLRLEVEGAHYIIDRALGEALSAQFDLDIKDARRYASTSDIEFPKDFISQIMRHVNLDPVLA